jgi:hypothetical protein
LKMVGAALGAALWYGKQGEGAIYGAAQAGGGQLENAWAGR